MNTPWQQEPSVQSTLTSQCPTIGTKPSLPSSAPVPTIPTKVPRTLTCIPNPVRTFDHQAHYNSLDEQTQDAIDLLSESVSSYQGALDASQTWLARVNTEKEVHRKVPLGWNPSLATLKEFARFGKTLKRAEDLRWVAFHEHTKYTDWLEQDGPLAEIIKPTYSRWAKGMDGEMQEMISMVESEGYEHSEKGSDICDTADMFTKLSERMDLERLGATAPLLAADGTRGGNTATATVETDEQFRLPRDDYQALSFRELMVKGFNYADQATTAGKASQFH
ncbi:hypothetical protein IAT38_004551 [Cryptococcus sp. DSM 104549]